MKLKMGLGWAKMARVCWDFVVCTAAFTHKPHFWPCLPWWPQVKTIPQECSIAVRPIISLEHCQSKTASCQTSWVFCNHSRFFCCCCFDQVKMCQNSWLSVLAEWGPAVSEWRWWSVKHTKTGKARWAPQHFCCCPRRPSSRVNTDHYRDSSRYSAHYENTAIYLQKTTFYDLANKQPHTVRHRKQAKGNWKSWGSNNGTCTRQGGEQQKGSKHKTGKWATEGK